ncbi:MAG: hypothetical protein AAGC84_13490, partial [Pseudomonas sp.]
VKATGLYGDQIAVPWLIQQMHDVALARVAGEAFSQISGADLALLDLELRQIPEHDAGPNDDPADGNVAMDEDENLPWPAINAVQRWWQAHADDFANGTAYLLGQPFSEANCLRVLAQGNQRQRIEAACLLARYIPTRALFPTSAPVRRQRRL